MSSGHVGAKQAVHGRAGGDGDESTLIAGAESAPAARLRAADAAGQRLFRELVVSRIAWASVMEASRLVAADVFAFSLRTTGCTHPPPCRLRHCLDRLRVRAVIGNRGSRLPALIVHGDVGVSGRVLWTGTPQRQVYDGTDESVDGALTDVMAEEGLHEVLGVPVSLGGEVHGVLLVARRERIAFADGAVEVLLRLSGYAGAALAAAYDRARVEAVAAARERRRLARALHDDLGQVLFGAGVSARLARESAGTGGADLVNRLHCVEQQVARASALLRGTLRSLDGAPAAGESLAVALREDVAALTRRTGIPAHLVVLGEPVALRDGVDALLLRAAREGLRNVERHAEASEAVLTLCFDPGRAEIVIQDDGVGPHPKAGAGSGAGLASLAKDLERAGGTLRLTGNEDFGATLRAAVPLLGV
jgi:LuxR family transcriptional regulator, regulator of acetate metabolism